MSPADAAKILELPTDATPEQLEARFLDLRRKLEDKIAKAPTPGLQAKYRDTLAQITVAFETLTLAADSSSLPVLQKPSALSSQPSAGGPAPSRAATPAPNGPPSAVRKPKSNKEFLIVAVIAVAVLGAGGWFVMKTRAEKTEQARVAAELAQKAADEKAQAELAAKAEANRVAGLTTGLRTKLAEARVEWEAIESDAQDAERRASDLKSELRGLRDAPPPKKAELSAQLTEQECYAGWLKNYLLRHPAKLARARTEELLQAKDVDAASAACDEMLNALQEASHDIEQKRLHYFTRKGRLGLESSPDGLKWIMTDPYGNTTEGKTTATLENLPLTHLALLDGAAVLPGKDTKYIQRGEFTTGKYVVRFLRPGWPDIVQEATLSWDNDVSVSGDFAEGTLKVQSLPAGRAFTVKNELGWTASGTTPATVEHVPPGTLTVRLSRNGYKDVEDRVKVEAAKTASLSLDQRTQAVDVTVAETKSKIFVDGKFAGYEKATLADLPPGEHALQLEADGYRPYRAKFTVKQESTALPLKFSFKALAVENITCPTCSGDGSLKHQERCNQCNGTAWVDCPNCEHGATGYVDEVGLDGVVRNLPVACRECHGKGRVPCTACDNGTYRWTTTCGTCGGDGRVSKLQLSQ